MQIIPVSGKVKFPITLDAGVWIFDDRKIKLEDAFNKEDQLENIEENKHTFSSDERFNREVYEATNDNKPIPRKEVDEIFKNTYVMPFEPFYNNVEVSDEATDAILVQEDGNEIAISLDQLKQSFLLFSREGKPLKEDGPVHVYFGDGSNRDNPIKAVKKIIID
ncbi:hypothetical protein M3210_12730 [Oceanobacillus luteolus]|uniref:Peptidyl-prolyl cis-trans isomerase n=1 Tax=Oceanobacillus luteolus TaxID=1274358 RepID=A0ABW4HSC7_9BACI|nr:hypothetical protein [Oceanobacillus luteolus]MCM3741135.1 hypothetical protein [Oceanobacillus luteolus]